MAHSFSTFKTTHQLLFWYSAPINQFALCSYIKWGRFYAVIIYTNVKNTHIFTNLAALQVWSQPKEFIQLHIVTYICTPFLPTFSDMHTYSLYCAHALFCFDAFTILTSDHKGINSNRSLNVFTHQTHLQLEAKSRNTTIIVTMKVHNK